MCCKPTVICEDLDKKKKYPNARNGLCLLFLHLKLICSIKYWEIIKMTDYYTCIKADLEKYLYEGCTVYRVIFAPCFFFLLLHLQMVLPHLKFAQTWLCIKEIAWNIGICPVLNSPADNEVERGENKTGANISLYTVCLQTLPISMSHT